MRFSCTTALHGNRPILYERNNNTSQIV